MENVASKTSVFGKIKIGSMIIGFAYLFVQYFGNIIQSIQEGTKTASWKPIAHAVIGRLFVLDRSISEDIKILQDSNISSRMAFMVKTDIFTTILFLGLIIFLLYLLIKTLVNTQIHDIHLGMKFWIVVGAIGFLAVAGFIYRGFFFQEWTVPFSGIIDLIKNWSVMSVTGNPEVLTL